MPTRLSVSTHLLAALRRRGPAAGFGWLLLLAHLVLITGCNYYHTRQEPVAPAGLSKLADAKLFLIHEGESVWQLRNPQLQGEVLVGQKAELAPDQRLYASPEPQKSPRYKGRDKQTVLNLVHVHVTAVQPSEGTEVRIPLAAMQRLDVVEEDTGKTILSYVLGSVGIAVGVCVLVGIIILLTKSSCPFVYAYDGSSYRFVGEAYGGAIFAPAERDDYMPLPLIRPVDQEYRLTITNELRERQYTNVAELWLAHHAADVRVLVDQTGNVHTIAQPQLPTRAVSQAGHNYRQQLAAPDHSAILFNESTPGTARNSVELTFANPTRARAGKLVLQAQNSLWLDYLYGEFTKKFGSYYPQWARTQHDVPARELREWSEQQGIPLEVFVETPAGWQSVARIPPVGPLAARELVVPFQLPATAAAGPVRLKLETGFMFWELDYAAVDFSPNQPVQLEKLTPTTARDEAGRDQRAALRRTDGQYLAQLRAGTEVALTYRPTAASARPRTTAFLHTRGYYEHIRQYEGLPNLPELYSFRQPGRFIEFSKERYQQSAQALTLTAANQ
ncbi:hypothetical protein [Hymenobacter pini]|uniref:hypothetical protein n=1 Tax=Hymenobacter pini TaxID=2880879 RepID=UPI001CF0FE56|nr:hypothetical protein [Hymenobacter pini]MCA8830705.1 hypothetical protein [Hymenobacter pini]